MERFRDRKHAGSLLAATLLPFKGRRDLVLLALPRGGVPVAYEIAEALKTELDVYAVRKLGAPGQEEYAIGALAPDGTRILNDDVVRELGITDAEIDAITAREEREIRRREAAYRGGRPPVDVAGKCVLLVDDGLATGATMQVAIRALRAQSPAQIIVAVPVAPTSTCEKLGPEVDTLVCLESPEPFYGVGTWYRDFSQTSDEEVCRLMRRASVSPTSR